MVRKVVEIRNLEYTYPDGAKALKGVSMDVFEGESVGVIGPNGAGKSTLLLHLNGILRSKNGEIRVTDMRMEDGNLQKIRRKVGLVFQDPDDQLFSPSVFDDVAFGPLNLGLSRGEVEERVAKALEQVNMLGYEGRSPHHLSFGEKKRISIATVLSIQPEILVLDEPTSNIDPGTRRGLIELLNGFEITKIIASHDIEMIAEVCDRVFLLYDGKMIKNGDAGEILTDAKLLESHRLEPPIMVRLFREAGYSNVPLKLGEGIRKIKKIKHNIY
ncbi:MAG: ATP-binding cassette domain-containing protein [Candidatus Hydrothermarchaeota archaeon]|nr:ATP-binding cassette domain-containing protein [Candidatus Hydrothermarchaeota archaeon]